MSHTPEPWWFDNQIPYISSNATPELRNLWCIKTIDTGRHYGNEMAVANARRIVACVNACAGMPIDDLEMVPEKGLFHLAEFANKTVIERDTYRDLCAELLQLMKLYSNNGDKIQGMVFKSAITKAESILGEKNGTAN